MPYPMPENETERNEAVRSYHIMNSPPEVAYDEIGELAAEICECPVSYVGFIEDDRFWMKAKYGLPDDLEGCPREIAFCSVTICGADLVVSPDLQQDERFKEFYFVVNDPHFRFYAAMPLVTPEGYSLGTICVMDFKPHQLTFEKAESLRRLGHQVVGLLEHRRRILELDRAMAQLDQAHRDLADEKRRSEELLHRILPEPIARELKETEKVEPKFFPSATVMIADICGFTNFTRHTEPAALLALLNRYYSEFDRAIAAFGLEKVKTIGDAYLAVAGVPEPVKNSAARACAAALSIMEACRRIRRERERLHLPFFDLRIGLHCGPLIAGVVGTSRFSYDIWGDAVNLAAACEAASQPNRINLSQEVWGHVSPCFEAEERGGVLCKDGMAFPMYFLSRLKREYSSDEEGLLANQAMFAELHLNRAGSGA
ncbi:hypothetical protein H2509_12565 [Stappia sp. F7233]|uniref:guanylate cyclase n=1 Tax=Stappia albiluteola TaxID=2758565 RepID=A0A839AFT4_9HYPH|nr:adenylate/guanylate cyclase domain-containing protein [Stappia albiluteola]MBA5777956.1 hypothetical protein [Stappia albiluteola]